MFLFFATPILFPEGVVMVFDALFAKKEKEIFPQEAPSGALSLRM